MVNESATEKFRHAQTSGKIVIDYVCLPETSPVCNFGKCDQCYILASEAYKYRVARTEEKILCDLETLVDSGYEVFLVTTELLQFKNYLKMLQTINENHFLTNGIIISQKPDILKDLKNIGIEQITLTGNLNDAGYRLPDNKYTIGAIQKIILANITPVLHINITENNIEKVEESIKYYYNIGVRNFRFGRFVPLTNNSIGPKPVEGYAVLKFLREIEKAKQKYPYDKKTKTGTYIGVIGNFGTQYRDDAHKYRCPVGKSQFTIGPDNFIYPCIYLMQVENRIGRWVNRTLKIDTTWAIEGEELDCPAFRFYKKTLGSN